MNVIVVVVIAEVNGVAALANAAVAALPPHQVTEGAVLVQDAPNVTVNSVALDVAVVPVVSVTAKP